MSLENGQKFTVEAVNNSRENVYIQSATLNYQPLTHNFIKYADINNGGTLRLVMGAQPNMERRTKEEDRPFSLAK